MPEGDTVWLAAKRMDAALAGEVLLRGELRVPDLATADLSGRRVEAVVPRGKHLLTRMSGDLTLHTHFRMDGSWRLYRPGRRWTGGAQWQIRALLTTPSWNAVGYRLPVVELVATSQEDTVVGHLGPDLLGPHWDPDEAVRRLLTRPQRQLGPALLDQRNLAGLGLLYVTEVCFLRGASPWMPVGDVPDLPALVRTAQRVLFANRDRWEQTTTGDTRRGQTAWVFGRGRQPCRRCGTRVLLTEQGEPDAPERARLMSWCPSCQPGPRPEEAPVG
jgi:endonuclease VIII